MIDDLTRRVRELLKTSADQTAFFEDISEQIDRAVKLAKWYCLPIFQRRADYETSVHPLCIA